MLVVSDAVADVAAAADKLRADGSVLTRAEMLVNDVEVLLETISKLQATVVERLHAAIELDATSELYGRSTKAWLTEDLHLAAPQAARLVRLARHLPLHPATQAAFGEADLGDAHAAAILTALQSLPPGVRDTVEPHLICRARQFPPEEIAGFTDELLQLLGIDTAGDLARERRHASRGVDLATTLHGTRSLSGTLTPEVGERLDAALTLAAAKTGPDDERSLRQRRHDALAVIADSYLAHTDAPAMTGAPRTVIVTIDLAILEGRLRDTPVPLPSGATISADTARRLACDANLIPAVLGGRSEILDIGQADHEFTTAIRRAAWIRDQGHCAFPDCRSHVSELHHLIFRRHHGPTSLHNAAWLCTYHHWLVHEGGWTLQRTTDGHYLWTSPAGIQRIRQLHPPERQPGTA